MSTSIVNKETPFTKLIETGEYEYYFERGQIVAGTIAEYIKDGVLVDIGSKSEAFLPSKEVADYASNPADILPIGNEYEFYILRDEAANSQDGRIVVSYKRVAQARVWSSLEDTKINDEICEARIQEVVKGGVVVEIDGLRGFIPASHLRVKGGSNNPKLVGETIPCTILEIDRQQNKLILSQKLAISKLYAGEREELMNDLVQKLNEYDAGIEAGSNPEPVTVTGEVVRITDFGAFVKISETEMDGLLPLSEIAWKRINHPSDILNIGEELKVQVLNVVPEQSRISLSLKRLTIDPWVEEVKNKLEVGDVTDIQVVRQNNFGVFVTTQVEGKSIEEYGFEAFLPYDDMKVPSPDMTQDQVIASYEIDSTIKAAAKKIKVEERRMVFSTRALDDSGNVIASELEERVEN